MRTLVWTIDLAVDPEELWAFHVDPRNAAKLAPPHPRVEVHDARPFSGLGDRFTFGLHIGPFAITWVGEIRVWEPPVQFMDAQVRGPFAVFEHTHRIDPIRGGSRLTDRVTYQMRGGPLAGLADVLQGRRALARMFAYRHTVLGEMYGRVQAESGA